MQEYDHNATTPNGGPTRQGNCGRLTPAGKCVLEPEHTGEHRTETERSVGILLAHHGHEPKAAGTRETTDGEDLGWTQAEAFPEGARVQYTGANFSGTGTVTGKPSSRGRVLVTWDAGSRGYERPEDLELIHAKQEATGPSRAPAAWRILDGVLELANALLPEEKFGIDDIIELKINGTTADITLKAKLGRTTHHVPWKVVE